MKRWDTSKGRAWVVVAFWGAETTTEFHRDEQEAISVYELAVAGGCGRVLCKDGAHAEAPVSAAKIHGALAAEKIKSAARLLTEAVEELALAVPAQHHALGLAHEVAIDAHRLEALVELTLRRIP